MSAGSRVTTYDFRRPNKVGREHVRALQVVHETFARQLSTILSTTLRTLCPVTVGSIEQQTYDEYTFALENPTSLTILAVDPLPGSAMFHLPQQASLEIVDRLLGGPGGELHPQRPLTEIEVGVLRGLLDRVMRELTYAFESLLPVDARITTIESNPQFAQVAALSDMVVVTTYDLKIGSREFRASLCFPFTTLQPALEAHEDRNASGPADTADAERITAQLGAHLEEAPVELAVEFSSVTLPSRDIIDLQPGDVLPLRHAVTDPLTVSVGGVPCFKAVPGRAGRRMACMVVTHPTLGEA